VDDYERIREAEGRGSCDDGFYLALPYCDKSCRNQAQWSIRAHTFDCLVERVLRVQLNSNARILDLGSGNCWLSFRLALEGYRPTAVDLLTNERDGLGAAAHYKPYLPEFFPRFRAELTRLPFVDGQFDAVVFNASFHYSEDDEAAMREALRCVGNNGIVIICDTPWYSSEESGRKMVAERRSNFARQYGTASDSIEGIEFLTNRRLQCLQERLGIRWSSYLPAYGLKWAMRPVLAKLKRKREPARFRLYVARKAV
jgi:SAM-dependent methyltransferase